ncbi:MAG: hypothetical protein K6T30_07555, partial [Alicyclobacillus sp.]|nr:hypothetical protein [Alicyclobacillus sp.]
MRCGSERWSSSSSSDAGCSPPAARSRRATRLLLPPAWWTPETRTLAEAAAAQAFPREVCGLWYAEAGTESARLRLFSGDSSPTHVRADPRQVVDFAYGLADRGGRVLATFHS